jgi:vacuolar protein sorting-associated protein 29
MVLVLCMGDLHIPYRAADLPEKFKALLVPGKIQHALVTGDLCSRDVYDYLKGVCGDLHVAKGEFDDPACGYPENKVISVGSLRLGVIHGHQIVPWGDADALASVQRQLGCDILVSGHSHQFRTRVCDGRLLVDPGSATGAPSSLRTGGAMVNPSFVLMDVEGERCESQGAIIQPAS